MIKLALDDLNRQQLTVSFLTTLKFVIFGILWIVLSDLALFVFHLPGANNFHIQVLKGVAFVVVMGIGFFITLQRQRPAVLELSAQELFKKNPIPMWIYDLDTLEFLEVNEAALSAYGYTRQQFLSLNFSQVCLSEETNYFSAIPHYQLLGKNKIQCRDGSLVKVELSSFKVVHKKNLCGLVMSNNIIEPIGHKKVKNDVAQQVSDTIAKLTLSNRELELRNREINSTNDELINLNNLLQNANKKMVVENAIGMQQKNNQIKQLMEQFSDARWCIDLTGQDENQINSAALNLFGISKEKVQDCPNFWLSFVHPEEKEIVIEKLKVLEVVTNTEIVFHMLNSSQQLKTIHQQVSITRDEHGRDVRIDFIAAEIV